MAKLNCWEILKCGREPGGFNTEKLGVCPAAVATDCDGLNGGKNAGRICWAIAGTFCNGKVQGTFAQKQVSCMSCEVFKKVKEEEGVSMSIMPDMMDGH
jgi:hypothetical protein